MIYFFIFIFFFAFVITTYLSWDFSMRIADWLNNLEPDDSSRKVISVAISKGTLCS